jgi:hypothetical protein
MMTTTAKPETEFLRLEQRFWDALKDRDTQAAEQLTDFPCIVTGAQGVGSLDRDTFAKMVKSPNYTIKAAELSDVTVRMLRDEVAVVAYKVHEQLVVDGQPVTFDAADSSTWIRGGDGEWRCAAHTEAIVGDPFGRDRRAK